MVFNWPNITLYSHSLFKAYWMESLLELCTMAIIWILKNHLKFLLEKFLLSCSIWLTWSSTLWFWISCLPMFIKLQVPVRKCWRCAWSFQLSIPEVARSLLHTTFMEPLFLRILISITQLRRTFKLPRKSTFKFLRILQLLSSAKVDAENPA